MNKSYFLLVFGKLFPYLHSERLRIDWAKKQLKKLPKGESIIDVGAGEMLFKKYSNHLNYISQDLGEYEGVGDKKGLQTGVWNSSKVDIISDITKMPIRKSTFNNALCTAVLEHVPYPDLAVKEIARILKKGGRLILDAPFCSQTHFSPYFFETGFSDNWYKEVLSKYGLKITKIESYGNYFDYLSLELVRVPLVFKQYSMFGIASFMLYILMIPLAVIIEIMSRLSKGSEKQLCFGYHVLAVKL